MPCLMTLARRLFSSHSNARKLPKSSSVTVAPPGGAVYIRLCRVGQRSVDNRDNDGGPRRRGRPPYLRAAAALSLPNHHAILAAIPRRAAGAASGIGGRRPPRTAAQGRARMEGAVALQQGEDAVVLRQ